MVEAELQLRRELRRARLQRGISQTKLSKTLGYDRSTVHLWENEPRLSVVRFLEWADFLGYELVLRKKSTQCDECEGSGYVVMDCEWQPYAVQCPKCSIKWCDATS